MWRFNVIYFARFAVSIQFNIYNGFSFQFEYILKTYTPFKFHLTHNGTTVNYVLHDKPNRQQEKKISQQRLNMFDIVMSASNI